MILVANLAQQTREASDPRATIRAQAHDLGFDAVGFAAPDLPRPLQAAYRQYIAQGREGDMAWLAREPERRQSPQGLWPEAQSVIVLGMNYGPDEDPLATLARRERATISVYARNRDYHDLIKGRLKQLASRLHHDLGATVKVFVDTAPVLEKPLAQQAAIGWQGKHSNLVSRTFGSWLFLGEIFCDLPLEPDPPEVDHCGSCRACLDICPTDAFPAPYQLDARRCISYLTIEHKGPHPGRISRADRQPDLWLRRLPCGLSLEQVRAAPPPRPSCRRGTICAHRRWPSSAGSTMLRSGSTLPARRSSGSGAIASCATC